MRAHAAFWAFVNAQGSTVGMKAIAASATNDPQKASDWLKDKAGRYYRRRWNALSPGERDVYFDAHDDPTFPLDESHKGIYDEGKDRVPATVPVTTPQLVSSYYSPKDHTQIAAVDRALLSKIARYKEASTSYAAALRTSELFRIAQACKASDEVKRALRSVSMIMGCLINDEGWQMPGDSRSSVVGAIQEAATAIEAATTDALLSSEDEVYDMMDKCRECASNARRTLHEVIAADLEDKSFSEIYSTRDKHPGKMQQFSALGWLEVEDAISSVSANTPGPGSEEAEAGDRAIHSTKKSRAKRRRGRTKSSSQIPLRELGTPFNLTSNKQNLRCVDVELRAL